MTSPNEPRSIRSICVFAGSNIGTNPSFRKGAVDLADAIADRQWSSVYGGGDVGLMGVFADQILHRKCDIVGVIPQSLFVREVAHEGLTELIVVDSMHTRKATMASRSDAFVALPGGMGTLEELFEVLTWSQIGIHDKPCGILNVDGYYDSLLAFLDHATRNQFIRPKHRNLLRVATNASDLLDQLSKTVYW